MQLVAEAAAGVRCAASVIVGGVMCAGHRRRARRLPFGDQGGDGASKRSSIGLGVDGQRMRLAEGHCRRRRRCAGAEIEGEHRAEGEGGARAGSGTPGAVERLAKLMPSAPWPIQAFLEGQVEMICGVAGTVSQALREIRSELAGRPAGVAQADHDSRRSGRRRRTAGCRASW